MWRRTVDPARLAACLAAVLALSASALAMQAPGGAPAARGSFAIAGDVPGKLRPGVRHSIRLVLTNRHPFPVRLVRVRIRGRVDAAHRAAGCTMRRDFAIDQLPRWRQPLIGAHSTRRLARGRPGLRLRNDPLRNQDACKGAKVTLRYRGRAERAPAVAAAQPRAGSVGAQPAGW